MFMRLRHWLTGLALLIAVLAAAGYAFRHELVLAAVSLRTDLTRDIAPNHPVVWSQAEAGAGPGDRPPNIVLIVTDDMGMNDLSLFGDGPAGGTVKTPHIDALARQGAIFRNGYAGNATCAPSRAMLMTGRYGTRFGFEFTPTPEGFGQVVSMFYNRDRPLHPMIVREGRGEAPPFEEQGMPPSELTVAELLKARGYHTVHIGKWHLGRTNGMAPHEQGFDESLLMASGLYLPEDHPDAVNARLDFDPIDRFLWAAMRYAVSFNGGAWFEPDGYLTDYFTDQAVEVIEKNRDRPFFLYLAHWGPHTPLQALKADYDALSHVTPHRARVYAAMLRALDRSTGRIMQALKENGLDENTLVIFTSDNGGAGYIGVPDVNEPYRGWKMTFFEGGVHVPFFMRWPGRIPSGSEIAVPASHLDILPTAAAAAGAAVPSDRIIDGRNLLPLATGQAADVSRKALFFRADHYQAVIAGGWKLQRSNNPAKVWLFHLEDDPTEQVNLAQANPEKVAELMALLDAHNAEQAPPMVPVGGEVPVLVDKTLADEATPEDEYIYWPG